MLANFSNEFLLEIKNIVSMDEIPAELVINFDQTTLSYVPTSHWTMEQEGTKHVEIIAKRQINCQKPPQVKTRGDQLPTDGPDHTTRPKGHHSGQG